MTNADIKRAAYEYAGDINRKRKSGNDAYSVKDFMEGAEWRINSVWHNISEVPKDGRTIVLLGKYGTMLLYGPNMMYYKESVIMDGGFLKWAYKEDLIPNTDE